jgi:hypothetical protein
LDPCEPDFDEPPDPFDPFDEFPPDPDEFDPFNWQQNNSLLPETPQKPGSFRIPPSSRHCVTEMQESPARHLVEERDEDDELLPDVLELLLPFDPLLLEPLLPFDPLELPPDDGRLLEEEHEELFDDPAEPLLPLLPPVLPCDACEFTS